MLSEIRSALPDRLQVRRLASGGDTNALAADARAGLTAAPKTLPPKYFYDELGSKLFEAICSLPEYYLTRAESEILGAYADEIARSIKAPLRLLELGSGSAEKTRLLIEALLRRQERLDYLPVDISAASLERSSIELLQRYPRLRITAYAADYFTALGELGADLQQSGTDERTMALFLGSNIGNFDMDEARAFLRAVRGVLKAQDGLLLGADLKKSAALLVPAYDDALGVTAAFNRNLLVRMNRELSADFAVEKFRHHVVYNEALGRVESHLVSTAEQRVRLGALDLEIRFAVGETIHTESSYKYDLEQLAELARATGFALEQSWFDRERRFSFNLFAVA